MLTKADDYPIHQTPEPAAYSGTDRNFYDRYFFNGYQRQGEVFFAAALGVYPHLNVMDAAFCVIHGGRQYNVHASRTLHMERLDTRVGPLEIEVIEPLQVLRVTCNDAEHGIVADLTFTGRFPPVEEPRFTRRVGSLTMMDYTRLTQNGTYEGHVEVAGERITFGAADNWGTRDRSWGIRPVGARDPQVNPYASAPQFYWLWCPLNFDDCATFYHVNADGDGEPWNVMGRLVDANGQQQMATATSRLVHASGTRHAREARVELGRRDGGVLTIDLTPRQTFYMKGLGYGHPEWSHGLYHGELETGFEVYDLSAMNGADPTNFHIQAICDVTLRDGGRTKQGKGVLEQLVIGPHKPSGFTGIADVAP
ncbi:MAG TPA: hypothetical protein VF210_13205 [Pseudomonadales bacterium]